MDKAIRMALYVFVFLLSANLLLMGPVRADTTHRDSSAASASTPQPFGMVDYKTNLGPYDPGIALSKEQSPFYPSRASTAWHDVKISMFDAPEVCGGCHTKAYKEWKGSMHSNAWTDPVYRAALNHVSKTSGGKVDLLCMGCHTPAGVVSGEANPAGKGMSKIADRGVHCDVCHNISDTNGIGNGAYVLTPKLNGRPMKFGPLKDAVSPYHDTVYSALHTRSEFCGQCHNVTHPFNRLPIERTYSEWKDSVYNGLGVQCQDCHMKPAAGKVTPFTKERPKVYGHYFVGGNAVVTHLLGSDMHADMARQMLKSAATVEIEAPKGLPRGDMASVIVKVTNVGAGHKLPTGFPEGREMWLDFKVTDSNGRVLYQLGRVRDGKLEPNTKAFKVVLGDKHGNPVDLELLEADRILYDTRIPPKGFSDIKYTFAVDPSAKGPLRIEADLNYWSFSPAWLEQLMGDKAPAVPIITMTSARTEVPLKPSARSAREGPFQSRAMAKR